LPARQSTRSKEISDGFHTTGDVTISAPHAAAAALLQQQKIEKLSISVGQMKIRFARSGVASPKIWWGPKIEGGKMLDFTRITLFCLEKRLSKHKMTIFSKNLAGA